MVESAGGTRLGGIVFGASHLTLIVTFPVSSTVTRSLGSFLGSLRFFQNSIALPLICMMAIRIFGGKDSVLAGARGGVGRWDELRGVGLGGIPSNSYRDFPCLIHVADFFGSILGSSSLFSE